jgi:Sulfatase
MTEPARAARPAYIVACIAAFYLVWPISLLSACHEWSTLRWSLRGLPFELLHSLGVMLVIALLALVPYCWRRTRIWVFTPCWTLVTLALVLRAADWVVYRHSGLHLSLLVTQHAEGSALRMAFGYIPVAEMLAPIATLALAAWLARNAFRGGGRFVVSPLRMLLPGLALVVFIWVLATAASKPRYEHALTGPEWTMFRSLKMSMWERACLASKPCSAGLNALDENIRRKLTPFGVRVNPREYFPLIKPFVYRRELPFPATAARAPHPNVIVILMESMSEWFVGAYHPERPSMTPHLDAFAGEATRVVNYYNSTTPTVTSLVAELCSLYPPSSHTEFGKPFYGSLLCAGNLLSRYGYQSSFIRGIEKSYANVGPFLESHSFRVLDFHDLEADLHEGGQSWGFSDHQLMRYLRHFLEKQGNAPFFVGMTTVDLHLPFNWTPVPAVVPGPDGQLLNIVHSTDDAFGEFWSWFKQSPLHDNTIVIVTGDHAIFPVPEYRRLRGNDWQPSYYDRLPLFIYDPGHKLPALWEPAVATSVDLLPTVLHLLGINDTNPFEGVSLFDDLSTRTGILGSFTEELYANQLDENGRRVTESFSPNCHDPKPSYLLTNCEQTAWMNWQLRLVNQRRIWHELPRATAPHP